MLNSMYTMEYYSAQLYPILCNPMDCSPPDSPVHIILQERVLEWVAIPDPGIKLVSSALQADSLSLIHKGRPIKRMKLSTVAMWMDLDTIISILSEVRKGETNYVT